MPDAGDFPDPNVWIGADLREWRHGLELTQEDAALLLETTVRTISAWENATLPLSRPIVLACRYLAEHPSLSYPEKDPAP